MPNTIVHTLALMIDERTSDNEALAALRALRRILAGKNTTITELLAPYIDQHPDELDRRHQINENLTALLDKCKTGRTTASYIKEVELLQEYNRKLERDKQSLTAKMARLESDNTKLRIQLELLRDQINQQPLGIAKPMSRQPVDDQEPPAFPSKPKNRRRKIDLSAERPKQAQTAQSTKFWTPDRFAWMILNGVIIDGDLATARRDDHDALSQKDFDHDLVDAHNRRFKQNTTVGAWANKRYTIRGYNTEKKIRQLDQEVIDALRKKGWDGRPSSASSESLALKKSPKSSNNRASSHDVENHSDLEFDF